MEQTREISQLTKLLTGPPGQQQNGKKWVVGSDKNKGGWGVGRWKKKTALFFNLERQGRGV